MINNSFLFDTYAFFEVLKGSVEYSKYKDAEILTTKLNIYELYLGIFRSADEKSARDATDKYYNFAVDFDKNVIEQAAKLKVNLNKRDLSMTDCIGYELAKQLGIKFLTGDEQFKDMENVEFVK